MADPRLGPPVLTEHGVVFRARRPAFDRFTGFDARNAEFVSTPPEPRLGPPVMLRDGSVAFLHAMLASRAGLS
jgi:hypothetical protein